MEHLLRHPAFYCTAGLALMLVFRESLLDDNYILGLILLSCLICIYAFFANNSAGSGSERRETGDNCYLIGFVYTLSVIAVTLMTNADEIGNEGDVDTVIRAVGIAMATSVMGMIIRLFFHYDAQEPENEFDSIVSKVNSAALLLKSNIDMMSKQINRMEEHFIKILGTFDNVGQDAHKALSGMSDEIRNEMLKTAQAVNENAETMLQDVTARMSAHIHRVMESFEKLSSEFEDSASAIVKSYKHSTSDTEAAARAMRHFSESVEKCTRIMAGYVETINNTSINTEGFEKAHQALQLLVHSIDRDARTAESIKDSYRKAFEDAAEQALQETHRLYAKLIGGATVALAEIDKLRGLSGDINAIAKNMERKKD